ncbi:FtsK/SpoIIIE domain-containing protein [Streptomyces albulus]|nr:FtsK/SpoIIIE domain-containing protein [Streptomyces noursei]
MIDPATLGHLHVIGSPRQGRSQTLRTIAGTLAYAHSPDRLHMYGIDCGNGALLAMEGCRTAVPSPSAPSPTGWPGCSPG